MSQRPLALVTGASSGIGRAYARLLAREGHDLWLVARRTDRLEELARELARTGCSVVVDPLDLSEPISVADLCLRMAREERLRVLIHNAGFGVRGEVGEADPARLLAMARVHVEATIGLCSAVAPILKRAGEGLVVVVASIAGRLVGEGSAAYCATKSFQISFARSLRRELSGKGIQVQSLCPGYTRSEFHDTPEYAHWDRTSVPSWLWTTSEQVAERSWKDRHREICVPGFWNRQVWHLAGLSMVGWIRERIRRRVRR